MRTIGRLVLLGFGVVLGGARRADRRGVDQQGILPEARRDAAGGAVVAEAARPGGEPAFRGTLAKAAWDAWLAETLPGERHSATPWTMTASPIFQQAECSERIGDLQVTWRIELANEGSTFRIGATLKNLGTKDVPVERFPVWRDQWQLGSETSVLRWWDSLSFQPHEKRTAAGERVSLNSQEYSSQESNRRGENPFWHFQSGDRHVFFALAWCGGWRADFEQTAAGTSFDVILPTAETALTLKPGEAIAGPIVQVTSIEAPTEAEARRQWLDQRAALDRRLYGGPKPWCPFLYNHWYAIRENFDFSFLQRQLANFDAYGFDMFVLDHGWFERCGDWTPMRSKFKPGELEEYFATVRKKGIKTGIWSCPWIRAAEPDGSFSLEIDEPHYLQRFMHAYPMDLAGMDFSKYAVDHLASLKRQFGIDWWKYDQELFLGPASRHGRMKNVVALQDALLAVRRAYPDLYIEDCMSGGRMINALTDGISQAHWIRDGSNTGLRHARSNLKETLGSVGFLAPTKPQRWMNRPDETDMKTDDLLRLYCRGTMIGGWGISGDLGKITPEQRHVILAEVKNYRRLNPLKMSNRYEVFYPHEGAKLAGIVFYDLATKQAAVMLFRWQPAGELAETIRLAELPRAGQYKVTDADTGKTATHPAADLAEKGLSVSFEPARQSAIYWVEQAP